MVKIVNENNIVGYSTMLLLIGLFIGFWVAAFLFADLNNVAKRIKLEAEYSEYLGQLNYELNECTRTK